jgi:hypothetical protein
MLVITLFAIVTIGKFVPGKAYTIEEASDNKPQPLQSAINVRRTDPQTSLQGHSLSAA